MDITRLDCSAGEIFNATNGSIKNISRICANYPNFGLNTTNGSIKPPQGKGNVNVTESFKYH